MGKYYLSSLRIFLISVCIGYLPLAVRGQITVTEDFDYGATAGDLSGKNGGTGFSGAWSDGAGAYTPTSLTFGNLPAIGGAMIVGSGSNASRTFATDFTGTGIVSGSFLFRLSSVFNGSVLMLGMGSGAGNNQGFNIALLGAQDGVGGNPAIGASSAGMSAMTNGASLSQNTTYMYLFTYDKGAISGWILDLDQYNHFFASGAITPAALQNTSIGSTADKVTGKAYLPKTVTLPGAMSTLFSYYFGGGQMIVDRISLSGSDTFTNLLPAGAFTLGFSCSPATIGDYYNGAGGPSLGVSFKNGSTTADGQLSTDPGPVINVPNGFNNGFSLTYNLCVGFGIAVYDGPDGTGNRLGSIAIDGNSGTASLAFSGTAKSVTLSRYSCPGTYDNLTFGSTTVGTPVPETTTDINVQGNGIDIADGTASTTITTGTNLGSVVPNTPVSRTFTIQNKGTTSLTVSSLTISGAHQSEFVVSAITLPAIIAAGAATSFVVTLTPTSTGAIAASVVISSDDCDEASYDFALQASTDPASAGGTVSGSSTVCAGTTGIMLSLPNQTGTVQTWQSSATSDFSTAVTIPGSAGLTSLTVSGITQTTYYRAVVQNSTNPADNSAAAVITVNPLPTADIMFLPALTICQGQSLTLTGSYSVPAPPPGPGNDPSPAPSPTPPGGGINPAPAPDPTPTNRSGAARRAATPEYLWSTGEFDQAIVVTPASSTVISLTAYNGTCFSNPVSVSITVNSPPSLTVTAAPGLTISAGQTATLTVSGADSYTWSTGTQAAGIMVNTAATYSVTGITNGCTATTTAAISLRSAVNPGAALYFDGSNDVISATGLTSAPPAEFTVEFWLNPASLSDYNQEISIGAPGSLANNAWQGFTFHSTAGGAVYVGTDMSSRLTPAELPMGTVELNTWQHFAYTFKNGTGSFYKNGVLLASRTNSAPANFSRLLIAAGCCMPVHGSIDELRIWTVARNCDEISQQRSCELTGSEANLLLYYTFNQGEAGGNNAGITTVLDAAGGNHNGTLTNFALSGSTSNWIGTGAVVSGSSCGLVVYPEINLTANSLTITDGTTALATANNTDFGSLSVNAAKTLVYTIENQGISALTVSAITPSGSGSAAFAVSGLPLPATISSGSSATFAATFTSATSGTFSAKLAIFSNDCDESSYDFAVQGIADPATVGGAITGSTTVCSTTNTVVLTLTNNTGSVIKWQSSTTSAFSDPTDINASGGLASLTVTNLSQTTYYRAVVQSGVSASAVSGSAVITVGTAVTVSVAANSLSMCQGKSVTLTASSNAGTYRWSTNETTQAISTSLGQLFTVTATGGSGCSGTATVTTAQRPLPLASITPLPGYTVCQGSSVTLVGGYMSQGSPPPAPPGPPAPAPPPSAPTLTNGIAGRVAVTQPEYLWSTGAQTGTISFIPTSSTVVSLTAFDGSCVSAPAQVSITVQTTPVTLTISNSQTICAGQPVSLTVAGANTYAWSNGGSAATNPVSPTATTSYTVIGQSGSCSATATVSVTVNPIPAVTITPAVTTISGGENSTLTAGGATSYTWNTPGNPTTGNIVVAPVETTVYSVTGSDKGCVSSATATIQVNCGAPQLADAVSTTITAQLGPNTCAVTLEGQGYGTTFTVTGPDGYVYSTVYRQFGWHMVRALNVTQPGTYVFRVSHTDACGRSSTDTITYIVTGQACR